MKKIFPSPGPSFIPPTMTKTFAAVMPFLLSLATILLPSQPATAAAGGDDPYLWLEQVESPTSLEWVSQQNAATTGALENLADYTGLKTDVKKILFAKDNVPFSSFRQGYFYNFWQDAEFKHGLIRRATLAEYRREKPRWDVILDLDKLSKQETENWVYKNSTQLGETSPRYILNLSRGGKDATVVREFDYQTREFIADGFNVPEANTTITPINENLVLLATSLDPADITNSGYPRSVKLWKRGQPAEQAETIYTAEKTDALVSAGVTRDGSNNYVTISRVIDFYQTEVFLRQRDGSLRPLPIPKSANFLDIQGGQVYAQLKDDLSLRDRLIPANTVLRFPLSAATLDAAEVVFSAATRQTIEGVSVTKAGIYVQLLDNVRTQVLRLNLGSDGTWKSIRLPFPDTGALNFDPRSDRDASSFPLITYTDYLTPKTQYLVHDEDESFRLEKLKAAPARFDA
ncbi:MAG: S9 family peptidase, partial [Proteobacteria bacterium]